MNLHKNLAATCKFKNQFFSLGAASHGHKPQILYYDSMKKTKNTNILKKFIHHPSIEFKKKPSWVSDWLSDVVSLSTHRVNELSQCMTEAYLTGGQDSSHAVHRLPILETFNFIMPIPMLPPGWSEALVDLTSSSTEKVTNTDDSFEKKKTPERSKSIPQLSLWSENKHTE